MNEPMEWVAEQWTDPVSQHAEAPLWDAPRSRLLWTDQYLGLVRSAATGREPAVELSLGVPVGAVVPVRGGGWMLAAGAGFAQVAETGQVLRWFEALPDDGIRRRMNDAKCDPAGRYWAGSMAFDKARGEGTLYVLERGGVRAARDGFTIANGTAFTPDGATMFHIDTPTRRIDRYRVASDGTLFEDGVAVRVVGDAGYPDGMCIDAEGALWVALWGAGVVHRYSQTGDLLGVVHVDAPQTSSCAFGGDDYGTLFITTSAENYGEPERRAHPKAGAIFAVRPGVRGLPADQYVG